MRLPPSSRFRVGLFSLVGSFSVSLSCNAQWALSLEQPFVSAIPKGLVQTATEVFKFDDGQQRRVSELLEEHNRRFGALVAENKPKWDELRARRDGLTGGTSEDYAVRTEIDRRFRPVANEQALTDRWLLNEIRGLLTQAQGEYWEDFVLQCNFKRWGSLPKYFAEEGVDVASLAISLETEHGQAGAATAELEAAVRRHGRALMGMMQAIDDRMVEFGRGMFKRTAARVRIVDNEVHVGPPDPVSERQDRQLGERLRRDHTVLRNERRRFLAEVMALMSKENQGELERRYWKSAAGESVANRAFHLADEIRAVALGRASGADEATLIEEAFRVWRIEALKCLKGLVASADALQLAQAIGIGVAEDLEPSRVLLREAQDRVTALPHDLWQRLPAHLRTSEPARE